MVQDWVEAALFCLAAKEAYSEATCLIFLGLQSRFFLTLTAPQDLQLKRPSESGSLGFFLMHIVGLSLWNYFCRISLSFRVIRSRYCSPE